jgi:hypothetical protein
MSVNMLLRLLPEWRGVGLQPMEQAGQGIMRRPVGPVRLHPRGFDTAHNPWSSDQKVDVIQICDFGKVHGRTIPDIPPTA